MKRLAITLVGAWLLCAAGLSGQSLTSLNGTVDDPSGAVVAAATVTLTNVATGAQRQEKTDMAGRFAFAQVQPGKYKIVAAASGFAEEAVNNVELLVNTPATINITFEKIGSLTEVVSVSAEAQQVNTTDASIGNAIGGKAISQLPFEARDVVGLLALQPGVTYLGNGTDYRSGSVNGGKNDQANVTLDGVDVNNQQDHTAFTSVLRVTLDSVEEFRTVTTNAGAELGRTSGAQVSLVTKGGTNDLHGSLYEYNRNTSTSANSFFDNLSGVPRAKLIRNVFGASLGGPVKRNRMFYFFNFEGRRDRSDGSALRIVPTDNFRNGYFNYLRNDGTTGQLTPDQVKAVDPLHIGADPAVLAILKQYPEPNDFTQGDTLNTAGYRFNAPTPLRYDTYIGKIDYQIDDAGKHRIFWRGNLQNDHYDSGLPQFPGQPSSSVFLENSKGYAAGYTAVLSPTLTSSFHYGLTRQGTQSTGILNSGYVTFRDIDSLYSLSTGLTAIIPVHQFSEDLAWIKGAHTLTFGGVARLISNNRVDFGHSFSNGLANSAVLISSGSELVATDAQDITIYKEQLTNLLGLVTQVTGQYNYDIHGNVLPQGAGIKRDFKEREYEGYLQDSWKISRALTMTVGLRLSVFPPVFEASGAQTSTNIPMGDWFNKRGALAAQGLPQSQAGEITVNLASASGGRGLYNTQKDWAPRYALAYSPQSVSGWRKWLFGGPGRTSVRAGVGMFYDLFGQGLIRSYDSSALGFSTSLSPPVAPTSPLAFSNTAPRFTGFYDLPTSYLPAAPPGGFPQTYPPVYAATNIIDPAIKSPYTINMDLSIGREFSHGLFIQGSYIGRLSRHSLIRDDLAMPTNLIDPASHQSYFQAAQIMSKLGRANTDPSQVAPIPFFENFFPGYAGGGQTATQYIYQNFFQPLVGNESTSLQLIDAAGCSPCSKFGPFALFSDQFASVTALRSRGKGDYHAMQWTVRKRFSDDLQFDFNYTFSKSIDLGSYGEARGVYDGQIQNAWIPSQMRGVSDYDVTHLFSAFMVAELPVGRNKRFLSGANRFVDGLLGGWQLSAIWRQSSGLPTGVGNGFNWPTDWQLTPNASQVGPVPNQVTTKNAPAALPSGTSGPNIFADPAAGLKAFDLALPGDSGQRNGLRGDGYFTVDLGLGKRFTLFSVKDHPHTLQFRAEAFNVSNTVRFDVNSLNITLGDPANFGKYTNVLTSPRVMQFSARYEF